MKHVLLVEDEAAIADSVMYALKTEGFEADWVATGEQALERVKNALPDLIILDIGLPDISGLDLLRAIRKETEVPVIFLTARASEIDRIVGLEVGADDYVVKPFSPRELTARVKAVLRRARQPAAEDDTPMVDGPFDIDEERFEISFHSQPLTLTLYEFRLLKVLIERPGRVYSREQLLDLAWNDPENRHGSHRRHPHKNPPGQAQGGARRTQPDSNSSRTRLLVKTRPMTVRTRIILVFIVVVSGGFFFLVSWITDDLRPRYLESLEEPLVDTAHILAELVAVELGQDGQPSEALREAFTRIYRRRFDARVYALRRDAVDLRIYVTDNRGIVVFDSDKGRDEGKDYSRWNDVYLTLRGEYGARSSHDEPLFPEVSVKYVAAPI